MPGTGHTLLIVDDDAALRNAIVFDFKRKGYDVYAAANGSEALGLIQERHFDCIISDIRMPVGDGVEFLSLATTLSTTPPRLIFVSGFADLTAELAHEMGALALLAKPFNRKGLFELVGRVVTPIDQRWIPQASTALPQIRLELTIAPKVNQLFRLGTGGFFIAIPDFANFKGLPDQVISFKITFTEDADFRLLEGIGMIRWVRHTTEENYPAGCGIEFIELTDACRASVVSATKALQSIAHIPRR